LSLGSELVNAVAAQDESALQACFAADVQFRALIPQGLRERSYWFEGVEEGEPYVVEQHLNCVLADGVIERANLLCSGFRPRAVDGAGTENLTKRA
jgi:hypothetical protein